MKGVPYELGQQLLSVSARDLTYIYLIHLNDIKTLRHHMDILQSYTDDMIVFNFGETEHFQDRNNGHRQMFKSMKSHKNMRLDQLSYIDPKYVVKAGTALKN